MASKAFNTSIPVLASQDNPIIAPYADPAPIYTGEPKFQTDRNHVQAVAIAPQFYDIRTVPVMVGYDFRKRIYAGF